MSDMFTDARARRKAEEWQAAVAAERGTGDHCEKHDADTYLCQVCARPCCPVEWPGTWIKGVGNVCPRHGGTKDERRAIKAANKIMDEIMEDGT